MMKQTNSQKTTIQQNRKALRAALRAVDHPLRQYILNALANATNGMAVQDITESLRKGYRNPKVQDYTVEQSMTSQHLIILKKQGLVYDTPQGKNRIYHLDKFVLGQLDWLCAEWVKPSLEENPYSPSNENN